MLLLEDTRQQESKHKKKHEYFRTVGIYWNRTALYCGDYTLPTNQSVCVDTKKDIQELIGDIQAKQMPKKEIKDFVYEICEKHCVSFDLADGIYHTICDEDENRWPEKEIDDMCFKSFIPESAVSEFQKLYVKRHGFFHRGLQRAKHSKIRLYVLVENEDGVTCVEDLLNWINPRVERYLNIKKMHGYGKWKKIPLPKAEPMSGTKLAKACATMTRKYGVQFQFCKPEESGRRIMELLESEAQDWQEDAIKSD